MRNRLKIQRAVLDLTQEELATSAGVARRTISAIERGRMVPSIVVALEIARVLSVPVDAIFSLPEAEAPSTPDEASW